MKDFPYSTTRTLNRTELETYSKTHPWITFKLDLAKGPIDLWMMLGAIQSKCEHVANVLLPPEVARELCGLYLAKGVQATTAIEGNTLSEEEVRARIEKRSELPKSLEYQGKEIDNILDASNAIANQMIDDGATCTLTVDALEQLNGQILKDLPLDEEVTPGAIRTYNVGVGSYRAVPHQDCRLLLKEMCDWLNGMKHTDPQKIVAWAVLRAVMAHLYIAWIHPFGDGNGRTARLVEVQILLGAGVPMIAAHLLSNHYNQTRAEYYRQLEYASKSGGDVIPFIMYAVQGLFDGLVEQIREIQKYQHAVGWKDYVYTRFRGESSAVAHRRRLVALELGKSETKYTPVKKIRHLTPELAEAYAGKTDKTVSRDLNELWNMRLVMRSKTLVRARIELLQSFTPRRREEEIWE